MKTSCEIFVRILITCCMIVSQWELYGCGGNPADSILDSALKSITPPLVTSASPTQKDIYVPVNVKITVGMWTGSTGGVDAATVNSSSFIVTDSNNNAVAGSIAENFLDAFTFTPDNNLAYSTTYTVRLTTGIKGSDGQSMVADYVFTFTTGPPAVPAHSV